MNLEKIKEIKECIECINAIDDYVQDLNNVEENKNFCNKLQILKEQIFVFTIREL